MHFGFVGDLRLPMMILQEGRVFGTWLLEDGHTEDGGCVRSVIIGTEKYLALN